MLVRRSSRGTGWVWPGPHPHSVASSAASGRLAGLDGPEVTTVIGRAAALGGGGEGPGLQPGCVHKERSGGLVTQISLEDFLVIRGGGKRTDVESFQFQKCSYGAVECVGSSVVFVLS